MSNEIAAVGNTRPGTHFMLEGSTYFRTEYARESRHVRILCHPVIGGIVQEDIRVWLVPNLVVTVVARLFLAKNTGESSNDFSTSYSI